MVDQRAAGVVLGGALALAAGCDRIPSADPSPPIGRPLAAPSASAPSAASSAPARESVPALSAVLPPRLAHFFAGYRDGSDFEFMRDDCAPTMERFVTLRNVPVATAIRDAKSFFRDKVMLSYEPDLARVRTEARADGGSTTQLPLRMAWEYPVPPTWGSDWPLLGDPAQPGAAAHVSRRVEVNVAIDLSAEGKILRYLELGTVSPRLRVTGDENCVVPDLDDRSEIPRVVAKKGAVVDDLGETVVVSTNTKGANTARKVRASGRIGWLMDTVSLAVENPAGGTSAGEASCLVCVRECGGGGDAGAR